MESLVIILAILGATLGASHNSRIFGGISAAPDQFPFIVSINDPDQLCAGTIINSNWILTAANCIIEASPNTQVLVGTTHQHSGGDTYSIKTMIVHEDFNYQTLKNNIGLIQINGELTFSPFVQPVEIGEATSDMFCSTAGWGMTETVEIPEDLQFIEVMTLSLDDCKEYDGRVAEEEVCAWGEIGQGFCYGDAGGPLVCAGMLVGMVSFSILPCGEGIPDVYTRVTAYVDWIDANIAK